MMKISWNLMSCAMIMYVVQFWKKVIKRRGQDIGIIPVHELFQIKLVQIKNFDNIFLSHDTWFFLVVQLRQELRKS